ncbi:MAG TPA: chemotaxis protein CheD [Thermodesulfobacteriota bacterium]|nr:chemotaxis protein CheD [Thermodesulfobacteriota bacterium]
MTRDPAPRPAALEIPTAAVYLLPGQARVTAAPTRFTTILGSCVAVCLFDPASRLGGINHFLLPGAPPDPQADPLRWGESATRWLVEAMLAQGAQRSTLEAKVFGGAHLARAAGPVGDRVGPRNVATALATLERLGIRVAARGVGGAVGRKLVFESHTGSAYLRELIGDA